jgi:hypothetical protein
VVAHTFNPSTWEAEAGGFLSSRPAWSTKWVPGQPGLHRETLSRKTKNQNQTKTNKRKKGSSLRASLWKQAGRPHLSMASVSFLASGFLPCLSSCPDFLNWWTAIREYKPNKSFPPQFVIWIWCFITATATLSKTVTTMQYDSLRLYQTSWILFVISSSLVFCIDLPQPPQLKPLPHFLFPSLYYLCSAMVFPSLVSSYVVPFYVYSFWSYFSYIWRFSLIYVVVCLYVLECMYVCMYVCMHACIPCVCSTPGGLKRASDTLNLCLYMNVRHRVGTRSQIHVPCCAASAVNCWAISLSPSVLYVSVYGCICTWVWVVTQNPRKRHQISWMVVVSCLPWVPGTKLGFSARTWG